MSKLSEIYNIITDIIILCNTNYEIIESNRAADIILGKGEKLAGKQCYQVLKNKKYRCPTCPFQNTLDSGKIFSYSFHDKKINEYFEERLFPVIHGTKSVKSFVLICRNISEARANENKSLQIKKLSALGEISSGVAHDFNNILTVVNGRINMLKRQTQDKKILKSLDVMLKATGDGAEKIRGIQEFARPKNDELKTLIDSKKLIEEIVEITEPKWKNETINNGIIIEIILSLERDLFIKGENSDLRNGFANIIFNAIDAMPDGGVLRITTYHKNNFAYFTFKDSGIGMTEDIQEKIFDPFFTTKGKKGTGIGMSEVYGLIKRHNGLIDIKSSIGIGTEIVIKLPIAEMHPSKSTMEDNKKYGIITILSVSSNDFNHELLQNICTDFNVILTLCHDYNEALKIFKTRKPSILVTDLGGIKMMGLQLAQKIKKMKQTTLTVLIPEFIIPSDEQKVYVRAFNIIVNPPQTMDKVKLAISHVINKVKNRK